MSVGRVGGASRAAAAAEVGDGSGSGSEREWKGGQRSAAGTRTRPRRSRDARRRLAVRGPPARLAEPEYEPAVCRGSTAGVPAGGARLLAVLRDAQLSVPAAAAVTAEPCYNRICGCGGGGFRRRRRRAACTRCTLHCALSEPGARLRTPRAIRAAVRVRCSGRHRDRRRTRAQARQTLPLMSSRESRRLVHSLESS